jgi:hypothetical protein
LARIGIITCSNCTQETNCASVVKELLCQTLTGPQTMADLSRGSMKIPPE